MDCAGYTIVPGFVDVHVHGGAGADSSDGDVEGLRNMAKFLLTKGVTSFCPTTMTVSDAEILKALETIRSCMDDKEMCIRDSLCGAAVYAGGCHVLQ